MTRDRINDASFRQKLDPISKNILRRLNPLELVSEDASTFDAENPIAGSLLRETDLKKPKQIVILSNHYQVSQGKNLRYIKRLDKLRNIKRYNNKNDNKNNNNNNNSNDGGDLFS